MPFAACEWAEPLSIEPANAFGTNAASFPLVQPSSGPPFPSRPRSSIPLHADTEAGIIEGAVEYGDGPQIGIVEAATGDVVRLSRTLVGDATAADAASQHSCAPGFSTGP